MFERNSPAAGSNNFVLSVKAWIQRTGAIGIMAKAGQIVILQMKILEDTGGRYLIFVTRYFLCSPAII